MGLPRLKTVQPNLTRLELTPRLLVWFSYETPIAFVRDGARVVRRNDWGPTTGRHLNTLDGGDKAGRVGPDEFEAALRNALA